MEKDILVLKNKDGIDEEVELILTINKGKKEYILYKTKDNEIYASYVTEEDDQLHNDLTEEEYNMLESIYNKGLELNDK